MCISETIVVPPSAEQKQRLPNVARDIGYGSF
jgi:hypothetical protein